MSKFISDYIQTIEQDFNEIKKSIEELKRTFGSTEWTEVGLMIESANEIWSLERRLESAKAIHKIILENYGTGK